MDLDWTGLTNNLLSLCLNLEQIARSSFTVRKASMLWLLSIVAGIIGLIYALAQYIKGNDDYWEKNGIEGIKCGDIATLWDRITFKYTFKELDDLSYKTLRARGKHLKVGGVMEFRKPVLMPLDLDLVKAILVKDFDYFHLRRELALPKDDPTHFAKSLVFMENQDWKDMRSTLTPTFTTGKIRRMFGIFTQSAKQMTQYLYTQIDSTGSSNVEMKEVSGRYTMNVIASSAFGIESNVFQDKNSIFYQMGLKIQNQFKGSGMLKFLIMILFPKLSDLAGISFVDKQAALFFKDIIKKTVKQRLESGEVREDFVQLMLETRKAEVPATTKAEFVTADAYERDAELKNTKTSKTYLTDDLILAQSMLFFMAGFDTIETLLVFAAYELALNPDVQEQLASDIREAVHKNNGEMSYEIINGLPYLDMLINETLRKYPVTLRLERRCAKDYKLPGHDYIVKKGDLIMIPVYGIHYDEAYYPNPEKFDPTRFSVENKALRNPYAYAPFGLGPRNCIGNRFALSESKAAIAELINSFVISPTAKTSIPMVYTKSIELRPGNKMWLKLTKRTNF